MTTRQISIVISVDVGRLCFVERGRAARLAGTVIVLADGVCSALAP